MFLKNPSTILGSLLILFSGGVLYLVSCFSTAADEFRALSPRFFPNILGWMILGFGAFIFCKGLGESQGPIFKERPEKKAVLNAVFFVVSVAVYLYFLPSLGFILMTGAFMIFSQWLLGEKSIPQILLKALVFTLAVNYIFLNLLTVPLPLGPWGF